MKRYYYTILMILISAGYTVPSAGRSYRTAHLQQAAVQLGIESVIEALPSAATSTLTTTDGQPVTVRISDDDQVIHIGHPLFHPDMRTLIPSPIYDFLEFAALDVFHHLSANTLQLSKVVFNRGSWNILRNTSTTNYECSIDNIDNKYYQVTWNHNGQALVQLFCPVDYELLANSSRRQMEQDFLKNLLVHRPIQPSAKVIEEDDLVSEGTDSIFVLKGDSYLLPLLNQDTYYMPRTVSERIDTITYEYAVVAIVIDSLHPAETMANLLISTDPSIPDARLQLEIQLSDYHRQAVNVTVAQWMDYCRQQGCKPYFASHYVDDHQLIGLLIMHNQAEGYNHLLRLTGPTTVTNGHQPVLQGKAYLYIPAIETSRLFGKTPDGKSNAKIFEMQ